MDHDPYTPPAAPVEDAPEATPNERPRNVATAVTLLWLVTAFNFAFTLRNTSMVLYAGGRPLWLFVPVAIGLAVAFGICWWVYGAVGKGRNWARIAVTMITVLGGLGAVWVAARGWPRLTWLSGYSLFRVSLTVVAVALLYSASARPWFDAGGSSGYRSTKRLTATSGLGQ